MITYDTSMFINHSSRNIIILLMHVDGIIVTGSSITLIQQFINRMDKEF